MISRTPDVSQPTDITTLLRRWRSIQNMQWNNRNHFFSVVALELRGVSDATVETHLRFARTWLYDRLHSGTA
jgi:hypothetical protein